MTFPKPVYPMCPGCARDLTDKDLQAVRTPAWQGAADVTCEGCGWEGALLAHTMGELLAMFHANSVCDLAGWIDEVDGRGVELPFPVNPRELMRYIDEFEELHLARLRAETAAEEAELAAESAAEDGSTK